MLLTQTIENIGSLHLWMTCGGACTRPVATAPMFLRLFEVAHLGYLG
jgi:hypothetical protein